MSVENPETVGRWGIDWLLAPEHFGLLGGLGGGWGGDMTPFGGFPGLPAFSPMGFSERPGRERDVSDGSGGSGDGMDTGIGGIGASDIASGASSFGGLLPLLGDSAEADSLGPLFRTLLALQTGRGGGKDNDLFSLFSGIQL